MPDGLSTESLISLLFVISATITVYDMYGRFPDARGALYKLLILLFTALVWFLMVEPLIESYIKSNHIDGVLKHTLGIFTAGPADDTMHGNDLKSTPSIPMVLYLVVLMALAMHNRIKNLPGLAFIIVWLAGVSFPLRFAHNELGNLLIGGPGCLPITAQLFLPAGFMALATMFYAPGKFSTAGKLRLRHILIILPMLLLYPAFFRYTSGVAPNIIVFIFQLLTAFIVYALMKKLRHRKWKDHEPLALVLMSMVMAAELPGLHPGLESLAAGTGSAVLLYIFIVSLNYNEKDPAYFLWIVFGLGSWMAIILRILAGFRADDPLAEHPSVITVLLSSGLTIAGLAIYVFLSTYMVFGLLNRIFDIKTSAAGGSFSKK